MPQPGMSIIHYHFMGGRPESRIVGGTDRPTTEQLLALAKQNWPYRTVQRIERPCGERIYERGYTQ